METKTLGEAFTEAWLDCENPELDSVNPHFGNKFASLGATLAVVRKTCKAHGLIYEQHETDGFLVSRVRKGDETIELSKMRLFEREDPQKHGIQLTYKKRQQAQADWGITGEEDTDGEGAQADAAIGRDYSELTQLAEEFAAIMGITPETAKKNIIQIHGNPKQMTDKEYSLYLARVKADVASAKAREDAND